MLRAKEKGAFTVEMGVFARPEGTMVVRGVWEQEGWDGEGAAYRAAVVGS